MGGAATGEVTSPGPPIKSSAQCRCHKAVQDEEGKHTEGCWRVVEDAGAWMEDSFAALQITQGKAESCFSCMNNTPRSSGADQRDVETRPVVRMNQNGSLRSTLREGLPLDDLFQAAKGDRQCKRARKAHLQGAGGDGCIHALQERATKQRKHPTAQ